MLQGGGQGCSRLALLDCCILNYRTFSQIYRNVLYSALLANLAQFDWRYGENMDESTNWQVENLRITVFPVNTPNFPVDRSWELSIGERPDNLQVKSSGQETREVEYGNGRIFLIKQLDRVEWRYVSKPTDDSLGLPIVGDFAEELELLVDFSNNWLNSIIRVPLNRLAFGAVLLCPVTTVQRGYDLLKEFLPQFDLVDVRDFIYRVNRRRASSVEIGLPINRLSSWNVTTVKLVDVAVEQQASSVLNSHVATRLELDINTAQERIEPLPSVQINDIFQELVAWGREISEQGDVK